MSSLQRCRNGLHVWIQIFQVMFITMAGSVFAADLSGSRDPPEMKRYEGSVIVGYRAPRFGEFLLPTGPPTQISPAAYRKSLKTEGLISRYTYVAPENRSSAEVLRNYKLEFERLGLTILFEKGQNDRGWFGPTFDKIADEDRLGQILSYNESDERVLVGASRDEQPAYYYVFVTSYSGNGIVPEALQALVIKDRVIVQLVVVAPARMEKKMAFVDSGEMSEALAKSGKISLYGIYFDTDKDVLRPDSRPTLEEIAKLMKGESGLKLRLVGHTDNQGSSDYNLDLSRRRAKSVVHELTAQYGIAASRLDAFGCGLYAPVASNDSEDGRAKNRRVELVKW